MPFIGLSTLIRFSRHFSEFDDRYIQKRTSFLTQYMVLVYNLYLFDRQLSIPYYHR